MIHFEIGNCTSQWHFSRAQGFIYIAIIAIVAGLIALLSVYSPHAVYAILAFIGIVAFFFVAVQLCGLMSSFANQQNQLTDLAEQLKNSEKLLSQIASDIRLSDTAKAIAYRDSDLQQLNRSVTEKLHQGEFDETNAMIEEIATETQYRKLAEQLKQTAEKYRAATDQERMSQAITYIEQLLLQYQWTAANTQIELLIKQYPDSEKAKTMRPNLLERKEARKKELLNAWDSAVKSKNIDRSLKILNELDLYLTPSEGLALQEAASQVFKSKLHNLGVQFSLAVSDKEWKQALQAAEDIQQEFPNSRMAEEIRSKMSILYELASKPT